MAEQPKIGDVCGKLTVVSFIPPRWGNRYRRMWCFCACGGERLVPMLAWKQKTAISCGCIRSRPAKIPGYKSPEFKSWASMKSRCLNPNSTGYASYGGRGIQLCAAWHEFAPFFRDMGLRPSISHSLDRIDPNGHYAPHNVRWALQFEQVENKCDQLPITIKGRTKTLITWARESGLKVRVLRNRIIKGYPEKEWLKPKESFTRVMPEPKPPKLTFTKNGKTLPLIEWSRVLGIPRPTLYDRARHGLSEEEILTTERVKRRKSSRADTLQKSKVFTKKRKL